MFIIKKIVSRNKGDKDYSKSVFVSLINDYSLFGTKQEDVLRNLKIMRNRIIGDIVCYSIFKSEWPQVKENFTKEIDHDNNYK